MEEITDTIDKTPDMDPSKLDPVILLNLIQNAQAQITVMEAEIESLKMKKSPADIE